MKLLATPVIGGTLRSLVHILIVAPLIFCWRRARELKKLSTASVGAAGNRPTDHGRKNNS